MEMAGSCKGRAFAGPWFPPAMFLGVVTRGPEIVLSDLKGGEDRNVPSSRRFPFIASTLVLPGPQSKGKGKETWAYGSHFVSLLLSLSPSPIVCSLPSVPTNRRFPFVNMKLSYARKTKTEEGEREGNRRHSTRLLWSPAPYCLIGPPPPPVMATWTALIGIRLPRPPTKYGRPRDEPRQHASSVPIAGDFGKRLLGPDGRADGRVYWPLRPYGRWPWMPALGVPQRGSKRMGDL